VNSQADRVRAKLLEEHPGHEVGTWQILGEDPNCDLGGPHGNPMLATVQGTYADIVEYALELPGFFTWGGGGDIEKVSVLKVDGTTVKQRAILNSRRQTLKRQLDEVEAELKKLGS